ncbi:FkbM family methyltransferase [Stachybotrys elegans]|uniref:FkbM family methyltransferase n=1 Tax=Stachybotrys elegans TaxID=80388 RepID=A0A8K0WSN0_9HYPO|nr:FkbM family methyltransferase [Stachybotrys elegans]
MDARIVHNEIFNNHCYDIEKFSDQPFMIDVGANIGLFSMYMKRKYPGAKILAFEPAPVTYGILQRNLELNNATAVQAYQCALGAEDATGTLSFYPIVPAMSTFVPEENDIMRKTILTNFQSPEVIDNMFSSVEKIEVPIRRLSDFLKAETSPDIDLLKIDVEARELEVCKGIDDEHWSRIRNVVVEIFDVNNALVNMMDFLKSKGFTVKGELAIKGQDDPASPKLFNVVGQRA